MVKKLFALCKPALFVGLLCLSGSPSVFAEGNSNVLPEKVVVKIDDLSNAERDMIVKEIANDPTLTIEFMCVPAGVMVISCGSDHRVELLKTISRSLSKRGEKRLTELTGKDQAYAEQACADKRNTQYGSDEK